MRIDGRKYSKAWRVYATRSNDDAILSYWHDIELRASKKTYNFVCEIPQNSRAKMEVAIHEPDTPIKQDVDGTGKLRYYNEKIPWNYGMLPRTWEDPAHLWVDIGNRPGDGDPMDIVEISGLACETGVVYPIRVLAALAMIDDGEVDWKIIAERCDSEPRDNIRDILRDIKVWFRDYKPGKKGKFGLRGKFQGADVAHRIIDKGSELYSSMMGRHGH